jgi:hypothetical protein
MGVLMEGRSAARRARLQLSLACLLAGSPGLTGLLLSQATQPTTAGRRGASLEYQVKAAYLLNFTRYVEWPSQTLGPADSPVTMCVLGADPFGNVLDATIRGKTTHGRAIAVRRIRASSETDRCHLVFISRNTWRAQRDLPKRLRAQGLLTVGESEDFAQEGGVIGFIIQNETVRFVVNAEASDRAGLRISSRMLSLAAAVYDQGSGT